MSDTTMIDRLKEFVECEGRSCSFDPELITPEYVYRMWGGSVAIEGIEEAFRVHGSWTSQAAKPSAY